MKCFYCGKEAVGICKCGRALCKDCCISEENIVCRNSERCIEIDKFTKESMEFNKRAMIQYDNQMKKNNTVLVATGSLYTKYAISCKVVGILSIITSIILFTAKDYLWGLITFAVSVIFFLFTRWYLNMADKLKEEKK